MIWRSRVSTKVENVTNSSLITFITNTEINEKISQLEMPEIDDTENEQLTEEE